MSLHGDLVFVLTLFVTLHLSSTQSFVRNNDLYRWLQDASAQKALREAWGEGSSPLEAAYSAAVTDPERLNISESLHVSKHCLDDILHVLSSEKLVYMLDASAKIPGGLLYGSWTNLGHFDECVEIRNIPSASNRFFHGKMCLVYIGVTPAGSKPIYNLEKPGESLVSDLSLLFLKLGVCVPSSCNANDVGMLFNSLLYTLPVINGVKITATVPNLECTTADRPDFDVSDWTAIAILSLISLLVVLSTCYDVLVNPQEKVPIFLAFSVLTNGRKLLAAPRADIDKTLSSLHGIRVLSTFWVIMGHRYSGSMGMPNINPLWILDALNDWTRVYITNATVSVDTFFMMSGLLVAYLFFKQPTNSRRLNLPMYYIHRYIRLTPALAFVILIFSTLLIHFGWGPLWYMPLYVTRKTCQETWWSTILYLTNYIHPMKFCSGHTWYLMVDMQLYWLAPIVLLPAARSPRIGAIITILLICGGLISNFCVSFLNHLPGNLLVPVDEETSKILGVNMYIATYGRFVPYLEGMILGYVLGDRKARGLKLKPLTLIYSLVAWVIVSAFLLVPLCTGYFYIKEPYPSDLSAAFYNSLHRPAWALGVAGVVYLCAIGNGGPVNSFLSWSGFHILSRFCYCMYLVHIPLQLVKVLTIRTNTYLSDSIILSSFASDLLVSFLLAGIMSVIFESPFLVLEKEMFKRFSRVHQEKTRVSSLAPVKSSISKSSDNSAEITLDDPLKDQKIN